MTHINLVMARAAASKFKPKLTKDHVWTTTKGSSLCRRCLARWSEAAATRPCDKYHFLANVAAQPTGHLLELFEAEGAPAIIVCATCGAYAESQPTGLTQACPGYAQPGASRRYTLLCTTGRHPKAERQKGPRLHYRQAVLKCPSLEAFVHVGAAEPAPGAQPDASR